MVLSGRDSVDYVLAATDLMAAVWSACLTSPSIFKYPPLPHHTPAAAPRLTHHARTQTQTLTQPPRRSRTQGTGGTQGTKQREKTLGA
ncbi:hypothetical protein E2C01_033445 [Portunus trituberculatus]|uniref:Uncharacterized protein n=1 Tax=Portunus trituberculatus TaxID=210409 RepID=A0A5B7F476_PORTR|nr:hypothetical protein [Portunus trituberculatus]